jgi:hypothetical protein
MKIYCRNYKCGYNRKLEEPVHFIYGRFYVPLFSSKDENLCEGECIKDFCGFVAKEITSHSTKQKVAECSQGTEKTCGQRCLWNKEGNCDRRVILVDKNIDTWICKCYSNDKISGHMDWSRLATKKDMF